MTLLPSRPVPFLRVLVLTLHRVPGMVRVSVGGGSDTLADVVHGERKQEVRLHLARLESGFLWREGQLRLRHGGVAHGASRAGAPGLLTGYPLGITSHSLTSERKAPMCMSCHTTPMK